MIFTTYNRQYLFDPEYFFELAEELTGDIDHNEDARYRTAVSRLYYAAHLISRNRLQKIGIKFPIGKNDPAGKIHELVIKAWYDIDNETISDMLNGLRLKRTHADYFLDIKGKFKRHNVQLLIDQAKTVIEAANKLTELKK